VAGELVAQSTPDNRLVVDNVNSNNRVYNSPAADGSQSAR
jgi:hypothetical protein